MKKVNMIKIVGFKHLQENLDNKIAENKGLGDIYNNYKILDDMKISAFVELGELANEVEFFKYWKINKKNNQERRLDEFADVMHFLLGLMVAYHNNTMDVLDLSDLESIYKAGARIMPNQDKPVNYFETAVKRVMTCDFENALLSICNFMFCLGYNAFELQEAYLKKNKVNYERQKNNY